MLFQPFPTRALTASKKVLCKHLYNFSASCGEVEREESTLFPGLRPEKVAPAGQSETLGQPDVARIDNKLSMRAL
jgi:hypothetical protein